MAVMILTETTGFGTHRHLNLHLFATLFHHLGENCAQSEIATKLFQHVFAKKLIRVNFSARTSFAKSKKHFPPMPEYTRETD